MSKFDEIAELAIDNYGIVTAAEAVKVGVALKSDTMKSAMPTNTRNSFLKNLPMLLSRCSSRARIRFGL